jgi:DNA-binding NarL/FixJ family response regulator
MKVLLVSADPGVRAQMALAARSVGRQVGEVEPFELLEAADGVRGMALAWKHVPDVVVADQITSRAGAFALTRELKGAERPHPARIVILLDRAVDEWLARWAGADAWFVKPVDPFALADAVRGFFEEPKEEAG